MLEVDTPYEMPDGNVLTVKYDEIPVNPRKDFDNLSTFVTFESRYNSPDKNEFDSFQEVNEMLLSGDYVYIAVEKYEHSGIAYYPYNGALRCRWDAAVVGFMFVSKEKICKWYGVPEVTKDIRERVYADFEVELNEYTQYCNGEAYYYKIETMEGEYVDSCGGYFNISDILDSVEVSADDLKKVKKVTTYHYERG